MKARTLLFPFLAALIALAGCDKAPTPKTSVISDASAASTVQSPSGTVQAPTQALPDFATVVEANKAAVVNITATTFKTAAHERPQIQSPLGGGEDDPLRGDDDFDVPSFLR